MNKKITAIVLAALCALSVTACGGGDTGDGKKPDKESTARPGKDDDPTGDKENGKNDGDDPEEVMAEIYTKYPDLCYIGPFHHGVAVYKTEHHHGGYIDTMGNILYENVRDVENFQYPYKRIQLEDWCIVDNRGNILVQVGKEQVIEVSYFYDGYFYVRTLVDETVAGDVYRVDFYNATTGKVVLTLDHVERVSWETDRDCFEVRVFNDNGGTDKQLVHMKDYDLNYIFPTSISWPVDLRDIPEFKGAYQIGSDAQAGDGYAAVTIKNDQEKYFYAVVDEQGNVTMKPQTKIRFAVNPSVSGVIFEKSVFCNGLCPAFDSEAGMWGYIDPQGNWVIEPQFGSAGSFGPDGYATVNRNIVIDRTGEAILAVPGWGEEMPTTLNGTYRSPSDTYGAYDIIEFGEDGKMTFRHYISSGTYTYSSDTYTITGYAFKSENNKAMDHKQHSCGIFVHGDRLYLNGTMWELVEEETTEAGD